MKIVIEDSEAVAPSTKQVRNNNDADTNTTIRTTF